MVDRPQDFVDKEIENTENLSAAEIKKMRRKANKAKAAEEKKLSIQPNPLTVCFFYIKGLYLLIVIFCKNITETLR